MSTTAVQARVRWGAERKFFTGLAMAAFVVAYVGFSRTFFLRPLFPDYPAPHEPIFLVHGTLFAAWCVLLVVQASLVGFARTDIHRKLGVCGAVLAAGMVVFGFAGALVAAHRPSGFVGIAVPPLQFMIVPFFDIVLFATFVTIGISRRTDPQTHKRWMMLATCNLLAAAFARWPIVGDSKNPLIFFGLTDLFVVALAAWDLRSRGRLHAATLRGGLALILSQPLRLALSGTPMWLAFAAWATKLVG
jgi:hypothetical protein